MSEFFKISLTIGDHTVSVESHSKEWVEEKLEKYRDFLKISTVIEKHNISSKNQSGLESLPASLTIPEFFRNYVKPLNIKSRPDLGLFFVYYLERISKNDVIKTADVASCFSAIGYSNHNKLNYTDILASNRKKGFLNYVNEKWALTFTGEDYILNKISTLNTNDSK